MGFTYPDKFTYLNTFVIQVAQRCLDNGGPTVLSILKLFSHGAFCMGPHFFTARLVLNIEK